MHDLHAEADEGFRRGEADAARRAGDDRDAVRDKCGMIVHEIASFLFRRREFRPVS